MKQKYLDIARNFVPTPTTVAAAESHSKESVVDRFGQHMSKRYAAEMADANTTVTPMGSDMPGMDSVSGMPGTGRLVTNPYQPTEESGNANSFMESHVGSSSATIAYEKNEINEITSNGAEYHIVTGGFVLHTSRPFSPPSRSEIEDSVMEWNAVRQAFDERFRPWDD